MTPGRLGIPGTLGALLLAAGVGVLAFGVKPLERRHAALMEQTQNTPHRGARAGRDLLPVSAAEGRLASFYAFFRTGHTAADHLAKLHALALHAGVEPRIADYRLSDARGVRLVEYSLTMPVAGSYGQIRAFLERALAEIPVLALDHVSMRRVRVADARLEAEVRFTVYLTP